jgi:hypothetical protein
MKYQASPLTAVSLCFYFFASFLLVAFPFARAC